uniref:Rho-GAP domain-containing protein n=1 Tax=Anopheles atroparvus TaxID=41427 RepID=A0AAG5CYW1_ANOAO
MTDVEESIKVRLDQETANRLQDEHPEQFVTLVRMHLSFELDLNTDTENDPTGLDKQKIKKWKGFHKKAKGCTSVKAVSPEAAKTTLTKANIDDLKQLIAFLELEENISQEGIFRKTGSLARQSELKNLLVQGSAFTLDRGDYTAHDCASVLKSFLADLSEPLLTELYYPAYCQVADLFHSKDSQAVARGEDRQLNALQLLLLLLPEENNTLLRCIIELLHRTIQHEATNKMSAENLATLFTPHLICPRKLGPEALHTVAQQMSGIVGFMIKTGLRLFHIPARLATDIRAYFVEQKRRKTMSPEHILNESTTSDSVANTVYTFVDREKTAEAHIMNSTDTALAQLYAHIQSLPESSKKKKLVSKFNRQNGYGTPLQVLMQREKNGSAGSTGAPGGSAGPMKYPRSISDSIKRHIFHKSLMSRTPKRSAGNGCQTPITFQESIMTPRSRKPVILLAGMNGNDQQQLSTTCASFSSLREEDEEADLDPITGSSGGTISTCSSSSSLSSHVDPCVRMLINDTGLPRIADELGLPPADPPHSTGNIGGCGNGVGGGGGGDGSAKGEHESSSLTSTFRDYLLSRSVMPESPADLSFASQSDDFDSSSETLEQLSESKMSESMLYCMNGNEPKDELAGAAAGKGSTGGAPVFSQADNNHHLLGCGSELDETAL